jgi:hypothetical protein
MRGWLLIAVLSGLTVALGAACFFYFNHGSGYGKGTKVKPPSTPPDEAELVEDSPPPGLPIIAFGPRDYFPVIRQPRFVDAVEGSLLLAQEEPVLGLVVGNEARAYSTNQLNDHEMVIDEIAGIPVLVTY